MSEQMINTIVLGGVFLLLFASAEFLYRRMGFKAEVTRKYVHISTGLLTMLFPVLIGDQLLVLLLCGSFFLILLLSMSINILPSINAVDRKTWGSLAYPVIVYLCFLVYMQQELLMYFYIPILILALCDPIATIVGKNWPAGRFTIFAQTKTFSGSVAFFMASLLTSFLLLISLSELSVFHVIILSLSLATATTFVEAISLNGLDNITIPAVALSVLFLFNEYLYLS